MFLKCTICARSLFRHFSSKERGFVTQLINLPFPSMVQWGRFLGSFPSHLLTSGLGIISVLLVKMICFMKVFSSP